MEMWFTDKHTENSGLSLKVNETLYKEKSPFQELVILDTPECGRVMLLDGVIMLTDREEFVYHEMIAHVPLYSHPNPKKVLIIGGGDGGTLREVVKHPSVERADLVEIDEVVVRASREFFPIIAEGFNSPKAKVMIEDGIKYVRETTERYDVILVDSTDPVGPAEGLFNYEFYQNCHRILKDDGILTVQSETPFIPQLAKVIKEINTCLKPSFAETHLYLASIPVYQCGLWSFTYAGKKYHPLRDFQEERYQRDNFELKYYNAEVHRASFALPNFVREIVKSDE